MITVKDVLNQILVKAKQIDNENKNQNYVKINQHDITPDKYRKSEKDETENFTVLKTDKHYEKLASIVSDYTQTEPLHINTWKRLYGKLAPTKPSENTLIVIAKFFDCESWEELDEDFDHIVNKYRGANIKTSVFVNDQRMELIISHMRKGTFFKVFYDPDREIELECIDRNRFRVVNSKNSSLKRNYTFTADNFVVGDTFSVRDVKFEGKRLGKYTAAASHVITYVSEPEKPE